MAKSQQAGPSGHTDPSWATGSFSNSSAEQHQQLHDVQRKHDWTVASC